MLPRREFALPRARRRLWLSAGERGFALIEVTVAMVMFVIIGTSLIGVLTSATATTKLARQRTLAQQKALSQIETIRSMQYDDIGISGGNPPGTLASTQSMTVGGLIATQTTQVAYVSDPGPLSYETDANYKKITVTITRNSDSKQLAHEVTYVAPPLKASATNAVVKATVVDYGNATTLQDVPVTLSTGPSAPRSDTTDASGLATFAALTPNPLSGPQAFYDLSVTPPVGYVTLYDTVSPASPAHVQLSPAQIWTTTLDVYKPATVYVQFVNADGTAFVPSGSSTATLKYTRNSTQYTKSLSNTGAQLTVQTMTEGSQTVQLIPGLDYSASALGGGFYQYDPVTHTAQTSLTANVPDAYPTTLTHTFTLTNAPTANVSVKVSRSGIACKGATVTISAGPWGGSPWNFTITGTTDASTGAPAVLTVPVLPTGTTYTIYGKSNVTGYNRTYANTPVPTTPSPFDVQLSGGSTTC